MCGTNAFAYNVSFSSKVVSSGSDSGFDEEQLACTSSMVHGKRSGQLGRSIRPAPRSSGVESSRLRRTNLSSLQELDHIQCALYIGYLLLQTNEPSLRASFHELVFPATPPPMLVWGSFTHIFATILLDQTRTISSPGSCAEFPRPLPSMRHNLRLYRRRAQMGCRGGLWEHCRFWPTCARSC